MPATPKASRIPPHYWLYRLPGQKEGCVFFREDGRRVKGNIAFREQPKSHPSLTIGGKLCKFLGRGIFTCEPWPS